MTVAVSNSGPLIHLALIGRLDLLYTLFEKVLIPSAVYNEVVVVGKQEGHADALALEREVASGRIVVESLVKKGRTEHLHEGLHEGESQAIRLAQESGEGIILLDDETARLLARTLGLKVMGTLGILLENVKRGHIDSLAARKILAELNAVMYLSSDVFTLVLDSIDKWSR
jgi:uncharacterized protein